MHKNHVDNCTICKLNKDNQELLQEMYVDQWIKPATICKQSKNIFGVKITIQALYRHIKAADWIELKKATLNNRRVQVVESVDLAKFKGGDAINAMRDIEKSEGTIEDEADSVLNRLKRLELVTVNQRIKELEGRVNDGVGE